MFHEPDGSDMTSQQVPAPLAGPGLSDLARQAILVAARVATSDANAIVTRRLQEGEPLASVEHDLGLIASRAIVPLWKILSMLEGYAVEPGASVAWAVLYESLRANLEGYRALQRPPQPAPDRDRS